MFLTFQREEFSILPWEVQHVGTWLSLPPSARRLSRSGAGVLLEQEVGGPLYHCAGLKPAPRTHSSLFLSYYNSCQAIRPEESSPLQEIHSDCCAVAFCTGREEGLPRPDGATLFLASIFARAVPSAGSSFCSYSSSRLGRVPQHHVLTSPNVDNHSISSGCSCSSLLLG